MDVLLTDDEAMVQRAAAEFLATESTTALVRMAERGPERVSRELWAKVAGLGWLGRRRTARWNTPSSAMPSASPSARFRPSSTWRPT